MSSPRQADGESPEGRGRRDPREVVRTSLIKGVAIIIPLVVTLAVMGFVVNFVSSRLNPVVTLVEGLPFTASEANALVVQVLAVAVFLVVVFVVGFVAQYGSGGAHIEERFDEFMGSIPGVGSVYTSFNEMSELLLDSDTDSFQDVKLVEYPGEDSYTVAFKTAETPDVIGDATGHEDMVTLFMPMAPNPVMGGFVIHVSRDRVVDVDLTVEQGIRSIVTSGVAVGENDPALRGLSRSEMRELGQIERVDQQIRPGRPHDVEPREASDHRREQYIEAISPEHSETPEKIAERSAERGRSHTEVAPAEAAGRAPDEADETDRTPAELADRDERLREPTGTTPAEVGGAGHDGSDPAGDEEDTAREG